MNVRDRFASHSGENFVVICSRFTYRGTIKEVGEDFIVLFPATGVEYMGHVKADKPSQEENLLFPITIPFSSVEMFFQPPMANYPIK